MQTEMRTKQIMKEMYAQLGISSEVYDFGHKIEESLKERFEKLVMTTHKNKQELINDMMDSYLLFNNDEYNSLDKKITYMLELLNIINEYVQLPAKCYGKEMPFDMNEIDELVKAKSRYHLAITNKINTAKLPSK